MSFSREIPKDKFFFENLSLKKAFQNKNQNKIFKIHSILK